MSRGEWQRLDTRLPKPARRSRRDRDDEFLRRFEALTGLRLHSTGIDALPPAFLARGVDPPGVLVRRLRHVLKPRTYNSLCGHDPGPRDWPWTFARLLQIPRFGMYSLLDLLGVLARADRAGDGTDLGR
jgi:hypothetical protein